MLPSHVTVGRWRAFACPHCAITFEKEWANAHFEPREGVAWIYEIRWTKCSGCKKAIITLEERVGVSNQGQVPGYHYETRAVHTLWPQTHEGIDPLTGLRDKKTFEGDLKKALETAAGNGDVLSLIYCDVDHIKKVNDTHGHPKGDIVLQAYGKLLERRTAGKGIAYRIGGEEFAVVLPRFELEIAAAVAETLRRTVEAAELTTDTAGKPLKVTSSFGVAGYPEHASDSNGLKSKADTALYSSKQAGRNRVTSFHPGSDNQDG